MRILLISDLHLSAQTPEQNQYFLAFLRHTANGSDAIYILGDLFEIWLGDDAMAPELEPFVTAMRQLSDAGTQIYFMHGNRDFLIGETFAKACGCQLLGETALIELAGQATLLMHGDQLCTDDRDYQIFRRQVRDPGWQAHFLTRPISERLALARQARDQSQQQTREKIEAIMDVNQETVAKFMREHGVKRLVHGHTHRPGIHEFDLDGQAAQRIVLGDWAPRPSLLLVDNHHLQLIDPRLTQ